MTARDNNPFLSKLNALVFITPYLFSSLNFWKNG
jgi:hypothetical protein